MTRRLSVAALLAVLGAGLLAAQQQPPPPAPPQPSAAPQTQEPPPVTFRVEINYVEVDAVVTDALGNPVTDLTLGDFEVLEDGQPQTITAFSIVNLPIERAERPLFAPEPIEPDVQTNTNAEGRIYLVVLDDLHTTFTNTPRVRRALREFFEQNFGVNDLAAVVYTSGRSGDGQDFTNNRRLLLEAVDKFQGRKLRSEALEIADMLNRPGRQPDDTRVFDPLEMERAMNARSAMNSIHQLAEFLGGVRGRRKALLLISEGISYNIYDVLTNTQANSVLMETADAVGAATRANVAIYAIDPRGLTAFEETAEVAGVPRDVEFSPVRTLRDGLRLSQLSLTVLAAETGGFAAVNRNDFADAFARVVRENSTYYVLGYYPANERRDGRFRRLEVRVKRPGLQVRSRRGYVAPRGRAPETRADAAAAAVSPLTAAVNDAVASPIPIVGIPMNVFAAAYKGEAPNAAVALAIELAGGGFQFTDNDGTFVDRLEVSFTAVDTRGNTRGGDRHTLSMTMRPETVTRVRERGFRVVSQIDLPPGRYQLRVGAAEEGAGRAGSVLYDIEVPDFYAPSFVMSGVSITSALAGATPTVRPKDPLSDFLPGPPTAARAFDNNDVVALFAEFYENTPGASPHRLEFRTTVRAEDGRIVFEDFDERSSADLQGASGGHGYAVQIPLGGLEPGTYVIRVEGRSRVDAPESAIGRDVLIRIR
ncbi:MAG: VWA domain-containing protein [Acidobacteria bacterium]|nr:VWA domain-containing protein [Acidobacteriota bacterium]